MTMVHKQATDTLSPQSIDHYAGFPSTYLAREVVLDIFLPPTPSATPPRLLLLNDGQNWKALKLARTLQTLYAGGKISPVLVVAIHADKNRMHEYGTAAMADYKHRGSKAAAYTFFLTKELLPFLTKKYQLLDDPSQRALAGFSLGGLSAFDIVWHHPHIFHTAGVFSGSFWWRTPQGPNETDDQSRIMHRLVAAGTHHPELKLWFQAGTEEEKEDRNNNGIIDVIDDIIDLMDELKALGYSEDQMHYRELAGGKHHESSWAKMIPEFLEWWEGTFERSKG